MTRITSPFGFASTAQEVAAGHDLSGRSVIITGGAAGLGLETARALVERGAEIILAVRRPEAAEAAIADLMTTATGRISVLPIDLASLNAVRAFADAWGDRPLDILINNAGIMAPPLTYTGDNLESQMGVNHFAHYLLGVRLAPALMNGAQKSGQHSRLVVLSSGAHRRSPVVFEDMHYRHREYNKWVAYGQSKTANALFAVGFNQRFNALGITSNAVMPGLIMTGLSRHIDPEELKALFPPQDAPNALPVGYKTPQQGAATSVWAAVSDQLKTTGGLYLEDCQQAVEGRAEVRGFGVLPYALDPENAERLWALSQTTTTS